MKTLVVIVAAPIAGGCAAPVNLTKPGSTTTDFDNDMAACEYDAVKYGSNTDR
jgi:hypothetical protein